MAAKAAKPAPKPPGAIRRVKSTMSREERAAYGEIQQGVRHLEKSIGEIQRALRKTERMIEADARVRIRGLRKDARAQLGALKSKQREAARILKNVSAAAGGSWQEVKQSADAILLDARGTAASVIDRFRRSLRG